MGIPDWAESVDHNQCFNQWLPAPSLLELQLQPLPQLFLSDSLSHQLSASTTTTHPPMSASPSQSRVLQGTSAESTTVQVKKDSNRTEKVEWSICFRKISAKAMDHHIEGHYQRVIICPWEKCNEVLEKPDKFRDHYAKQ